MDQGEEEPTGNEAGLLGDGDVEEMMESLANTGEGGEEESISAPVDGKKKTLSKPRDWDSHKRQKSSGESANTEDADTGTSKTASETVGTELEASAPTPTQGKKPSKRKRHDWAQIAQDYIEGVPSEDPKKPDARTFLNLREIAERHDAGYQVVRARSGKERWADKKDQHALQVARERQKSRTKRLVDKSTEFDDDSLKAADIGLKLITTRLGEIAQEVSRRQKIRKEALEKIDNGIPLDDKSELYSAINYREVEGLGNALSRFQEIGRRALGTDIERHELSGPGGEALSIGNTQVNIQAEITRDDPERAAAILSAMEDVGLFPSGTLDEILGEVVEEGDE